MKNASISKKDMRKMLEVQYGFVKKKKKNGITFIAVGMQW